MTAAAELSCPSSPKPADKVASAAGDCVERERRGMNLVGGGAAKGSKCASVLKLKTRMSGRGSVGVFKEQYTKLLKLRNGAEASPSSSNRNRYLPADISGLC
jgi:hypothetical protein